MTFNAWRRGNPTYHMAFVANLNDKQAIDYKGGVTRIKAEMVNMSNGPLAAWKNALLTLKVEAT